MVNLNGIDAVLHARGIDTPAKLSGVPPQVLSDRLGADALVYGTVRNYEAYYLGLIAAWRVGVEVTIVSTHNGDVLVQATGSRFDTNLLVALDPEDIAISSAENLLELRDINLARAKMKPAGKLSIAYRFRMSLNIATSRPRSIVPRIPTTRRAN